MRNVLTNFQLFVDGIGYLGEAVEYQPPALTVTLDEFRAGGLDSSVPIDMGMEPLEASFAIGTYNPAIFKTWGKLNAAVRLKAKGALVGLDGTVQQVVEQLTGKISGLDPGAWAAGTRNDNRFTMRATYYRREIAGQLIHEIDVQNAVRIVDGVDQLAAIREAMGA